MAEGVATVDLRSLDLSSGAGVRLDLRVPPVALRLGGQDYTAEPAEPEVRLDVSRSLAGLHFRLRTAAALVGPCWRCVGPARVEVVVDSSEFQADGRTGDDPFDEDFDSPYVTSGALDVGLWTRDAIAEGLPPMILCREDCAGLCPTCGIDRNVDACDCAQPATDSRWDALRELSERLGGQG
jgi:uncharacterized protein